MLEIGMVQHNGRTFAAMGATVQGPHVTGYLAETSSGLSLTTWDGRTMLACRSSEVRHYQHVNEFGDSGDAIYFQLTHGRFICGYSLGIGMLFRGELHFACDEAARHAMTIAEYWIERDSEDSEDSEADSDSE